MNKKELMNKKSEESKTGYATVVVDDGDHYRNIANILTVMGYPMNHSSARNYVIRIMKMFVAAFGKHINKNFTDSELERVAKSPVFQNILSEKLHLIEQLRKIKANI